MRLLFIRYLMSGAYGGSGRRFGRRIRVGVGDFEERKIRLGLHASKLGSQLTQRQGHDRVVELDLVAHLFAVLDSIANGRVEVELVDGREFGGEAAVLFERE